MNNTYPSVIFLIISSDNLEQYKEMKRLSQMYFSLFSNIKFFYIQFKNNIEDDIYLEHELFFKGEESFVPGIYLKSVKALQYINQHFEYDFVIRTNLSSFWHMNNLFELLSTVPTTGYIGGYGHQGFISGTGIIMSRDIGNIIANSNDLTDHMDDVVISNIIQAHGYSMSNVTNYKWSYLIQGNHEPVDQQEFISNGPFNPNITFSPNVLYFRIRNEPDRNIDLQYFKLLLDKIYNIKVIEENNIQVIKETIVQVIEETIVQVIEETNEPNEPNVPNVQVIEETNEPNVQVIEETTVYETNSINRRKKLLRYVRR
jgi:hypothetical protein